MATVTVYTAERMKQIEDESVVSGYLTVDEDLVLVRRDGQEIQAGSLLGPTRALLETMGDEYVNGGLVDVNGHLILSRNGGGTIDAGNVVGPQGPEGPAGPAGTPGPTDHGALTGLADDDHPQYVLHTEVFGEQIAQTILGSAAASVVFSSITQTYRSLIVFLCARSDAAGQIQTEVRMRFNGETSGTHPVVLVDNGATGLGPGNNEPAITRIPGAGAAVGAMGTCMAVINGYRTNKQKIVNSIGARDFGPNVYSGALVWANNAAITSLSLTTSFGNFIDGSEFTLLGVK